VRPALPLLLLFAAAAGAQLPSDGRTSYSRDERISLPFELRSSDRATEVTLYASFADGPWKEADSIKVGGKKGFIFLCDREGPYAFATMTHFSDGHTDPARVDDLKAQKRVVYDRTPPRVQSVRAVTSPDGDPGIEWELSDDYLNPKGVKLEFRWDGQGRYDPIDRGAQLSARGARYWKVKPKDRMQVRVVATDWAGNKTESDPVWVAGKDADHWGGGDEPVSRPAIGASGVRDPAVTRAGGPAATFKYVKSRTVNLKVYATVGPSGLKKATLWVADEKLEWVPQKDTKGPIPAVAITTADQPQKVPVDFTYEAPADGLFHFIVVLENHRQANRPNPVKGTPGDIQVMVDTTAPKVDFVGSPRVAPNGDRGAIVDIRWKATDANIAQAPIKLEYRAVKDGAAGGGWKVIQDWMENTGQHTWTVPTGEGHEFVIKVTCKDRAGNETAVETSKPVNVDLSVPGVDTVEIAPGVAGMEISPGPAPGKSRPGNLPPN
jgi:hypothetical protein